MSGGGGSSTQTMDPLIKSEHSYMFWGCDATGGQPLFNSEPRAHSLMRALEDALDGNIDTSSPYYDAGTGLARAAFNPNTAITLTANSPYGRTEAALTRYQTWLDGFTSTYDDYLDDAVSTESEAMQDEHFRSMNRIAGSFAEINAVNGSAFAFSMMGLENARLARLSKYRSDLQMGMLDMIQKSESELLRLTDDFSKFLVTAEVDRQETDIEWKAKAITWDLDMFQPAANAFASISGAASPTTFTPRKGSKVAGALGAGIAGAAAGAEFGPAGIVAGGIGGLLSGL